MELNNTELAEIVSTRTCHDLIGCIGSLGNIVELIAAEEGALDGEMRGLLCEISTLLSARQKLFRIAFGLDTKAHDNDELFKICQDYVNTLCSHGEKIELELQNATPQLSKMICLCVMIASDVFIKGGKITIAVNKDNITIAAKSDYKFNEGELVAYKNILEGRKTEDNISKYAQLYYLIAWLGKNVPIKLEAAVGQMQIIIG